MIRKESWSPVLHRRGAGPGGRSDPHSAGPPGGDLGLKSKTKLSRARVTIQSTTLSPWENTVAMAAFQRSHGKWPPAHSPIQYWSHTGDEGQSKKGRLESPIPAALRWSTLWWQNEEDTCAGHHPDSGLPRQKPPSASGSAEGWAPARKIISAVMMTPAISRVVIRVAVTSSMALRSLRPMAWAMRMVPAGTESHHDVGQDKGDLTANVDARHADIAPQNYPQ